MSVSEKSLHLEKSEIFRNYCEGISKLVPLFGSICKWAVGIYVAYSIAGSVQFSDAKAPVIGTEKSSADPPMAEQIKVPDDPPKRVAPEPEDIFAPPIRLPEDPNAPEPVFYPVSDRKIASPASKVATATTDENKKVAKKQSFPIIRRIGDGLSNGWDYLVRLPAQSAWGRVTSRFHK